MRKELVIVLPILAAALAAPVYAQAPGTSTTVMASEPGKAMIAQTVELSAKVVAIDKADRVVTLRGKKGDVDVVCGDEVKNFDQIKLGDTVTAKYVESLYLELAKTKAGVRMGKEGGAVERAELGQRPAGAAVKEVVILADVVGVDPNKMTITLKGPKNNTVTLPVHNPDQFKVVKKGDQVEATYTQAFAIAVTPTPAK
ncbi:MAG TPA: hypothetical protein VEE84_06655 [Burkholderiaceae bacterium]|nr:hypothetical protein [Burkholderiaceae bacterium]